MFFQDFAEVLVAAWVLSDILGDSESQPLSAASGELDRALQKALECGAFPVEWRSQLHFVDARTGLRCVELEDILLAAQRAGFVEPDVTFRETWVKIGLRAAHVLLRRQSLSEEDVRKWGLVLRDAINQVRAV